MTIDIYNKEVVDTVEKLAIAIEVPYSKAEAILNTEYSKALNTYEDNTRSYPPHQVPNMPTLAELAQRIEKSHINNTQRDYRAAAQQRVHTAQNSKKLPQVILEGHLMKGPL